MYKVNKKKYYEINNLNLTCANHLFFVVETFIGE